jgi:sodium/potassium/calcium exchanger 6
VGGQGDLEVVLGALTGAGVFVTTVVLGAVLLVTPRGQLLVAKASMQRDVLAYLGTVIVIVSVAWDDKITAFDAFGLLFVYFAYVTTVVVRSVTGKDGKGGNENGGGGSGGSGDGGQKEVEAEGGPAPLAGLTWPAGEGGTMLFVERAQVRHAIVSVGVAPLLPQSLTLCLSVSQVVAELPFTLLRWASIPSADAHWDPKRRAFAVASPSGLAAILMVDGVFGVRGGHRFFRRFLGSLREASSRSLFGLVLGG